MPALMFIICVAGSVAIVSSAPLGEDWSLAIIIGMATIAMAGVYIHDRVTTGTMPRITEDSGF